MARLEAALGEARELLARQDAQIGELTSSLSRAQAQAADSLSKLAQRVQDAVERDEAAMKMERDLLAAKEEAFGLRRRLEDALRSQREYKRGMQEAVELCEKYRGSMEAMRRVDISRAEERVRQLEERISALNRDAVLMRYVEELESLRGKLRASSAALAETRRRVAGLEGELAAAGVTPRGSRPGTGSARTAPAAPGRGVPAPRRSRGPAGGREKGARKSRDSSDQPGWKAGDSSVESLASTEAAVPD